MELSQKEIQRRKNNEVVLARWRKNQELAPLGKISRRFGIKTGSRPWHDLKDGKISHTFEETKSTPPRYSLIPNPKNPSLLKKLLEKTTARLGVWRAGVRPLTKVLLDFQADHAVAKSAVYEEFPKEKIRSLGLTEVKSLVNNKEEFLLRPDLGRKLNAEGLQILSGAVQNPDVQIVISDGLSGIALEVNIEKLLPQLSQVLSGRGYRLGTPIYCKYARVALQDRIGEAVRAKVCLILIGERPGLGTGDGLSCYLIYNPNKDSSHANRNCISNIHPRGLEVLEAAKYIEYTVAKMFEQKTSGVDLDLN